MTGAALVLYFLFRLEARLEAVEAELAGEKRKNSGAEREEVTGEAAGGDLGEPAAKRRKATAPVPATPMIRGREAPRPQRSVVLAAVAPVVRGAGRGRGRQVVQELPVGRDISLREGEEVEEERHRCSLRCPVSCQVTPSAPSYSFSWSGG